MRVVIDASAIVAVLGNEAGRAERVREGIEHEFGALVAGGEVEVVRFDIGQQ